MELPVSLPPLLSLLAEGAGRHAALSLLHQLALQASGGSASLLFEPHPTSGHLHPTSGAGLDLIAVEPWAPAPDETALVSQAFARPLPLAVHDLATQMPQLYTQLHTPGALLVPLAVEERRVGLLTLGTSADPDAAAAALADGEVRDGFTLAIEVTRLRQREAFEQDVRSLLDGFTEQLTRTLDVRAALEPICVAAARLFAADRMTVWAHDRESRALAAWASSDAVRGLEDEPVRADDPLLPAAAALRTTRAGLASEGAGAIATLTVPLRGYRRALGTLVFEGVRLEPGDDLALLNRADELGRRLSTAIETTQLLDVVASARRELDVFLDALPLLVVVVDEEMKIERVNEPFAIASGRAAEASGREFLGAVVGPELLAWLGEASGEDDAKSSRVFVEPRLGGEYAFTRAIVRGDRGRIFRVMTGRSVRDPRESIEASRATL